LREKVSTSLYTIGSKSFENVLSPSLSRVIRINIPYLWSRLALLPFLLFLAILSHFLPIILWQPRPNWLDDALKLDNLLTRLFQRCYYYGDGFLQLITTPTPFWLRHSNDNEYSILRSPNLSDTQFYYMFDLFRSVDSLPSYSRIPPSAVLALIERYLLLNFKDPLLKVVLAYLKSIDPLGKLVIFPLTTFSETGRCQLENEAHLYREFLGQMCFASDTSLLPKPHPANSATKVHYILRELEVCTHSYSLAASSHNEELINSLSAIPLELLLLLLFRQLKLPQQRVTVICTSTAALSVSLLFPGVSILQAFGSELVYSHLNEHDASRRLKQETLMSEFLCSVNPEYIS